MPSLRTLLVPLILLTGCSDAPSHDRDAPSSASVHASLYDVDTAALPRLPRADAARLPHRIPPVDADLPALLDDLPGRAVVVVNPSVTVLGTSVESWSDLELLVCGVDGRWRRLNLGDLGLPESLILPDTYGAGELSSDGRWWAGPMRDGTVLLDLRTGEIHTRPYAGGSWVPGRNVILVDGAEVTIPDGAVRDVPYGPLHVGHEPDGTPLSLERGPDGQALLVEWDSGTRRLRTPVDGPTPPRRRVGAVEPGRAIPADRLTGVVATSDMVASGLDRGRDGLGIVAVDSTTGEQVGTLTWERSDFELFYDDVWLDEQTLLIAARPWFLAWRPATGEVFRLTGSRTLSDGYWDVSLAPRPRRDR